MRNINIMKHSTLALLIVLLGCGGRSAQSQSGALQNLVSKELRKTCDSTLNIFSGRADSADYASYMSLELQDSTIISTKGGQRILAIISCSLQGEILLLNYSNPATETDIIYRERIRLADLKPTFGELVDINHDGYNDLRITGYSGAHSWRTQFLTIYEDSVAFIEFDGFNYLYSDRGGVRVEDRDGDGQYEVYNTINRYDNKVRLDEVRYIWGRGGFVAQDTIVYEAGEKK